MAYMLVTDSFMSSWGRAPGRSLVAFDLAGLSTAERAALARRFKDRPEFKRLRNSDNLPRLRAGDHLSVWTRETHPNWVTL